MIMLQDVRAIVDAVKKIQETPFYRFIVYIEEKNSEDRDFSRLRKEFPDMLEDLDNLEFLISHEIIWIEMNGTVRPGKVAEYLYTVVSKISKWTKE